MEVRKGYKQTEVGVIPTDWGIKQLRDISYMKGRIGWQGLKKTEFTMNADEPYLITGMNFKDGSIRWDEVYHVSHKRYQVAKDIQLKQNDILMTKDGTIGKLLYVENIPSPGKATLNSHLLVFRPIKNSYFPRFLYYQLSSKYFNQHIELSKSGSTFFGISQESVGNYNAFLPSLTEQAAIATALSDADALIQSLEKLIAKKRNIKQGAMQELLKAKEGWVVKLLPEVLKFISGKAHEQFVEDFGKYIIVNSKFISTNGEVRKYTNENYCPARKGDILQVMSDLPNGRALAKCYLVETDDLYAVNQRVCILRAQGCDPRYLFYVLDRNKYFLKFDDGVQQTHLLNNVFKNCPIPLPSTKTEQTRIATILNEMDTEISTLEAKLAKYKQLKQGMMQELLTGRIRLL